MQIRQSTGQSKNVKGERERERAERTKRGYSTRRRRNTETVSRQKTAGNRLEIK